jgi:hypothetical protein
MAKRRRRNGRSTRPPMTAEEARQFDHMSAQNAVLLRDAAALRGCECEPYRDWFTYGRWRAQGYQVQKGEHGVRLGIIIKSERREQVDGEEKVTTTRRPWSTHVFCRCQVQAKAKAREVA